MATTFVLPSGRKVTRSWAGALVGFRYELQTDGDDPVQLLVDDVQALASLAGLLMLRDLETHDQIEREGDEPVKREHVDPTTEEVTTE